MNFSGNRFAIVIGSGYSDTYLAYQLLQHFPDAVVIRYHVRKIDNYRYYLRKFFRIGMLASANIKMLAVYLSLTRLLKPVANNTTDYKLPAGKVADCHNAETLDILCRDRDFVLVTQGLRLKDHFCRSKKVLQIVGGRYPAFCGDTAMFWAWAMRREENYCYSLILRNKYFIHSVLAGNCMVALGDKETISSLRLKGIKAMTAALPVLLQNNTTWMRTNEKHAPLFLNAPTVWTYIMVTRFGRVLKQLPKYATR